MHRPLFISFELKNTDDTLLFIFLLPPSELGISSSALSSGKMSHSLPYFSHLYVLYLIYQLSTYIKNFANMLLMITFTNLQRSHTTVRCNNLCPSQCLFLDYDIHLCTTNICSLAMLIALKTFSQCNISLSKKYFYSRLADGLENRNTKAFLVITFLQFSFKAI